MLKLFSALFPGVGFNNKINSTGSSPKTSPRRQPPSPRRPQEAAVAYLFSTPAPGFGLVNASVVC